MKRSEGGVNYYCKNEVLGPRQIPISAIGCMVIHPVYKDLVMRLMTELIEYDPSLAFPVYYKNGTMMQWKISAV